MRTLRAWLRLIRVAALPTALADVWLGAAVVDEFATWHVVWLSLISLALYAAGMILNDAHDVERDRVDNPDRPLPSGEIGRVAAACVGVGLLALAVAGAVRLSAGTGAVAGLLALLILAYNFLLKDTAFGPVNMGLCRAANVLLGMSCLPPGLSHRLAAALPAVAPIFIYITGVTWLARREAGERRRGLLIVPSLALLGAGALTLVVSLIDTALAYPALPIGLDSLLSSPGLFYSALVTLWALAWLWLLWRARRLRGAVAGALIGIIPLQALVAVVHMPLLAKLAALCIMLLLVPLLLLRWLSHIT